MVRVRHLSRAPISEAILDIRVQKIDRDHRPILSELAEDTGFPSVQIGFEFQADLPLEPGADLPEPQPAGFRAVSEEQIVQFRFDGVSVSRLRPYGTWDELVDVTRSAWDCYRDRLGDLRVSRLGARYVNHLRLPYPGIELETFFEGLPADPPEWPSTISSLLQRRTLHEGDFAVHISHALADDVDEGSLGMIFDIDAFTLVDFGGDESEAIWETFARLRELKNRIFFGGLTDEALSHYE